MLSCLVPATQHEPSGRSGMLGQLAPRPMLYRPVPSLQNISARLRAAEAAIAKSCLTNLSRRELQELTWQSALLEAGGSLRTRVVVCGSLVLIGGALLLSEDCKLQLHQQICVAPRPNQSEAPAGLAQINHALNSGRHPWACGQKLGPAPCP